MSPSRPARRLATATVAVVGTLTLATTALTTADARPAAPGAQERSAAPLSRVVDQDSERFQRLVRTDKIMGHLRELQVVADRYGNRASGTEGYNASSRYVEAVLRDAGYTPRRQYFPFTYFEVIAEEFTAGGDEYDNITMTGSPNTPTGGITAELVVPNDSLGCDATAWDGVDATGKIALISRGSCAFGRKSLVAGEVGAAGAVIYNNDVGPLNGTLGDDLDGVVPTTGILQADGQALAAQVAEGPVTATLNLDILTEQRRSWNVVAATGRGRTDNVVMLGAHLDGVLEGPGINDNGSGSATLLETAVQLKKMSGKLNNRVRFAWWGAEEDGLVGSTYYVNQLVENDPARLDDIATYLNFDMLGSPNFQIGVYDANASSFEASAPVPAGSIETERAFRRYFRAIGQPAVDTEFSGRSDYQAFIENGVASGGLFSGADDVKTARQVELFGGTAGITHDPNYHSPGDDIDNVSFKSLTIMSNAIAHLTISLGKSTAPIDTPSGARPAPKRIVTPVTDQARR